MTREQYQRHAITRAVAAPVVVAVITWVTCIPLAFSSENSPDAGARCARS